MKELVESSFLCGIFQNRALTDLKGETETFTQLFLEKKENNFQKNF